MEYELLKLGVDILDAENPFSSLSLRRLYVLYSNLPLKNQINFRLMKVKKEDRDFWKTEHILADLIDAVQQNTYVLQKANSPKGNSVRQPKPYPRPKPEQDVHADKRKLIRNWFPGRVIAA